MSLQKQNKAYGDSNNITEKLRSSISNGTTFKLFEDDYFIFELIKLLYDNSLDINTQVEILTVIEQYACGTLPSNSFDQVITALLDIYQDSHSASQTVASQLLITLSTLFLSNDELLDSDLCAKFVVLLTDVISKVNNVTNRRLRACCCQCLSQLVSWKPGLLWRWREALIRLVKEEKTDVIQDYMVLLINVISSPDQTEVLDQSYDKSGKKTATPSNDLLSTVSQVMDNVFLMTPAGLTTVVCSIAQLVKTNKDLHPTIFKALMLQYMSSLDPNIVFLMLYIQKEFRGQILSSSEERTLLNRAMTCVNLPSLSTSTRLIIGQWLLSYLQDEAINSSSEFMLKDMSSVVFDPLDLHTLKLAMINSCSGPKNQDVSGNLHYLNQLADTTGGARVTCHLFRSLFLLVTTRSSQTVRSNVLRITKKLFQNFPHLIPMMVDFLRAVKENQPHDELHQEILSLLHDTVLSLAIKTLLGNYQNYLQVWMLSAQDVTIQQQKPLIRLLELVQEARYCALDDWSLGSLVLTVCRTMILHHHTDLLYTSLGDLLYFMLDSYSDCDIRDQARFFYTILTVKSDAKAKELLAVTLSDSLRLGENITDFFPGSVVQTKPAELIALKEAPLVWLRTSCDSEYTLTKETIPVEFPKPVTDNLSDYWDTLYHLQTVMICNFTLSLIKDSDYDFLVAVSFVLSNNKNMAVLQDSCLPYLNKGESKCVHFKLLPKLPEPRTIKVKAQFGFSNKTYECDLLPVTFELRDFLQPFPWDLFNIDDKETFFCHHWENYTLKSKEKFLGVESVKILQCSRNVLLKVWEKGLVFTKEAEDCDICTDHYLFFLPPRFHLLFCARTRSTDVVVHIASDYWPVLGFLDEYLEQVSKTS
ncbi:AP-5 complex subunit beta-1 [Biomphalaria pfeifferi]|uniref:AP-5 complex subunit beta-1 n=1 Tax=Biomphalaria pfeifferi TaxID=112525 RepID=A0AAD8BPQ1_BIOPF|nr:AP-5 complex subunit beta-1 [Biomphalaria pfeifferi]